MKSTFPIITDEKQKEFEVGIDVSSNEYYIPIICGYCGRACRQLNKEEGANRMVCTDCSLAEYCK